jgi:glutathione S-transferase
LLEQLNVPYEIKVYHRAPTMKAPRELAEVHPLGKSPVVTITPPGGEPFVLAETPFIVDYISDHFTGSSASLQPNRWKDGQEGKVGGETDEWMRYQYIMYYAEGSFMASMAMYFVLDGKSPNVPSFNPN